MGDTLAPRTIGAMLSPRSIGGATLEPRTIGTTLARLYARNFQLATSSTLRR